MKKSLSLILAFAVIFSVMFIFTACGDNKVTDGDAQETTVTLAPVTAPPGSKVVGEGSRSFVFTVVDVDGKETYFDVRTDKTTVGEALLDCKLIEGEEGPYGLYVKTVDGTTLDYDKDGKYWAFYIDGEYAPTGVDVTEIDQSKTYSLKAE